MFDDRTPENLKAEMLAEISESAGVSTAEGSFAESVIAPAARKISEFYQTLPMLTSMLFVDENSGGYMDLVGKTYFNITRRAGTKARCTVTLNGDVGCILPTGTVFLTADGKEFSLLEAVTLPDAGAAEGMLEAAEAGSSWNVGAGEITRMYINPLGLASFTNGPASGGTDEESDTALLQRIRDRRAKPANGANGWQYRQWALSVDGVGEAKVVELADGPGTVSLTITDSNLLPAASSIVEACRSYIQTVRPVGAAVTIQAAQSLPVRVAAEVNISAATTVQTVQTVFAERLRSYMDELIQGKYQTAYYAPDTDLDYTLVYNRVLALLMTVEGVQNVAALTINGAVADVTIPANSIPVPGTVVLT